MSHATVTLQVHLPIAIERDGDVYVACCPDLDVYSQGDTVEEAKRNIQDAVAGFVSSCYDRGVLDKVLSEAGFTRKVHTPEQQHDQQDTINIPVPLYMLHTPGDPRRKCGV